MTSTTSTKLTEPEPDEPRPDRQPASTEAPASAPQDAQTSSPVDRLAKAEQATLRVVLYQPDRAAADRLRETFLRRGFEVRTAGMFNHLGGWLMLYGESAVLVLELPTIDTFRKAVLKEVRRLAPGIGVVALAKVVTPEVQRDTEAAHVAHVLPADASPDEVATAVELARQSARSGVATARAQVLEEEPE